MHYTSSQNSKARPKTVHRNKIIQRNNTLVLQSITTVAQLNKIYTHTKHMYSTKNENLKLKQVYNEIKKLGIHIYIHIYI